jgi:uncharacterized membrane protein
MVMAETTTPVAGAPDLVRTRFIAIAIYGLYLAALINGITAVGGVVLAYVGRRDARGTVYEHLFSDAIHTFWISVAGFFVIAALMFVMFAGGFGGVVGELVRNPNTTHVDFNLSYLIFLPVIVLGSLLLLIWYLYRSVTGLVHAIEAKPGA